MSENYSFRCVASDKEFAKLCQSWKSSFSIALDTEFMRTNTFYAKMGLLQIADDSGVYLIDPLQINDWDCFRELLVSDCMIVVHSAGEDLNLLLTHVGLLPKNLFDTQLAAAFLGLGFSLSYQALVENQTGITIEKGETRSDWLKRPLTDKQLHYAANDVVHLLGISDSLHQSLQEESKISWFNSECASLLLTAELVEDRASWNTLHLGISNAWRLNDNGLSYLRRLCLWRELESRQRNKPRSWIAKDNDLHAIAASASQTESINEQSLKSIKLQEPKLTQRYGSVFLELLSAKISKEELVDRLQLNVPLDSSGRKTLKTLKSIVEEKAAHYEIAPELLGRKKQLLDIIKLFNETGELHWDGHANQWRKELLAVDFAKSLGAERNAK